KVDDYTPRRHLVLCDLACRAKRFKVLGVNGKAGRNRQVEEHHRGGDSRPVRHGGSRLYAIIDHERGLIVSKLDRKWLRAVRTIDAGHVVNQGGLVTGGGSRMVGDREVVAAAREVG